MNKVGFVLFYQNKHTVKYKTKQNAYIVLFYLKSMFRMVRASRLFSYRQVNIANLRSASRIDIRTQTRTRHG